MRFKNFKIGKDKNAPESDAAEANDAMVNQIADLEEQVNGKTKELEETEQQLQELSDTLQSPEEEASEEKAPKEEAAEEKAPEEEASPQPHGPLDELTVEPGDLGGDEVDTSDLFEESDEGGAPVVEVIKAETIAEGGGEEAPVTVKEVSQEAPSAAADSSLSGLFSDEEEEANPLAALIEAMPDVTSQELLEDLQEIQQIIKDWRH